MSRELVLYQEKPEPAPPVEPVPAFWEAPDDEREEPGTSLRRPLISGLLAIGVGFGGFLFWGFTTNLDSAAVATGNVIVDSQRKTVSHLEGGILKRLRVVDGETVAKGQALIELDDTRARSELEQLSARRIGLLAKRARLRAEQSLRQEISFPTELSELTSEIANDVITGEKRHFEQRRSLHDGRIAIQEKEIEQLTARLEALPTVG